MRLTALPSARSAGSMIYLSQASQPARPSCYSFLLLPPIYLCCRFWSSLQSRHIETFSSSITKALIIIMIHRPVPPSPLTPSPVHIRRISFLRPLRASSECIRIIFRFENSFLQQSYKTCAPSSYLRPRPHRIRPAPLFGLASTHHTLHFGCLKKHATGPSSLE